MLELHNPSDDSHQSTGNGPDQGSLIHKFVWAMNIILVALLQVKSQDESPLTRPATIAAFIVAVVFYFWACYTKEEVKNFENPTKIIEYYARLFGFLSNDLLLLMLVPILGWICLGIWLCCFFAVTFWSYMNINTEQFRQAIVVPVREMLNTLMSRESNSNKESGESGSEEPTNSTNGSHITDIV